MSFINIYNDVQLSMHVCISRNEVSRIPVYLGSSYKFMTLTINDLIVNSKSLYEEFPPLYGVDEPDMPLIKSSFVYHFLLYKQLLYFVIFDGILRLLGRKPFLINVARKVHIGQDVLKPFTNNPYPGDGMFPFYDHMMQITTG